jgi:hypothetical protein
MAKAATSSAASMYPLIGSSAVNPAPPGLTPTANNTLPPNYNSASGSAITTSTSCMSVLGWVQFVLQKLAEIQWRQIGTETGTGRPLYEMTNPNMVIEEIYQRCESPPLLSSHSLDTTMRLVQWPGGSTKISVDLPINLVRLT